MKHQHSFPSRAPYGIPDSPIPRRYDVRPKLSFRFKFLSALFPLWLIATHYLSGIDAGEASSVRAMVQVSNLALMALYCFWLGGKRFVVSDALLHSSAALFFLVALSGALSAAFSVEPVRSLSYWFSFLAAMVLCAGLWNLLGDRVADIMGIYSVLATTSTFVVYLIFHTAGRYAFYVNSNTWGLYCFSSGVMALFIKNRLLATLMVGLNSFVLLKAESRGSIVGFGIAFFLYAVFLVSRGLKTKPIYIAATLFIVSIGVVAAAAFPELLSEQVSEVLLLTNRGRGVGSGFTGRTEAWGEALDTFQKYPLLGVGFRLQDLYIDFGGLRNAHNGYLSVLIEIGLFGFLMLISFLGVRVYKTLTAARKGNRLAQVGFCLWAGYAFIGMFDSRLINAGNPTSLLVWFFLLMPDRASSPRIIYAGSMARPQGASIPVTR